MNNYVFIDMWLMVIIAIVMCIMLDISANIIVLLTRIALGLAVCNLVYSLMTDDIK